MKKIAVILALLVSFLPTAYGYNVTDDTTVFGYRNEEYGPKPTSMTVTLFTGSYFNGLNQNFPDNVSKFNNVWRYGVRLGYAFTRNFELDMNLAYSPTVDGAFNLNVFDYGMTGFFNIIASEYVAPYLSIGAGAIKYKETLTFDFTRFQFNYGGGIKFFAFPNMAIAPEFRAITNMDPGHTAFTATLNFIYYTNFRKAKPADRDHDGIADNVDKCPDQPETFNGIDDWDGCPEAPPPPAVVDLDRDHDGVLDSKDQCPNTPLGTRVNENGCPLDSDGDGVPDYKDQCLNTPAGAKVDEKGCEPVDKDLDKDGVLNEVDQCPDTPLGVKVDVKGCPLDTDGDGVPDYKDKCPNTKPGTKVDPDGCEVNGKDTDRDGVIDDRDTCPNTPIGVKVDEKGCPLDTDGDGIPDYKDKCPTQKEIYNGYKDEDGCPDDELDEFSGVIEGIYFESNQTLIKKESYPKLNRAAEVLGKYKTLNFVIEGHTDSTGGKAYNQGLSERRAQTVYEYLRYRGISPDRMTSEGFGLNKPIATNKTVAGRAKNRRIEFRILNLEAAKKEAEDSKNRAQ